MASAPPIGQDSVSPRATPSRREMPPTTTRAVSRRNRAVLSLDVRDRRPEGQPDRQQQARQVALVARQPAAMAAEGVQHAPGARPDRHQSGQGDTRLKRSFSDQADTEAHHARFRSVSSAAWCQAGGDAGRYAGGHRITRGRAGMLAAKPRRLRRLFNSERFIWRWSGPKQQRAVIGRR